MGEQAVAPGGHGWTLVGLAQAAGVTRGVARAALRQGYLPKSDWRDGDVALLRVAAALLGLPGPAGLSGARLEQAVLERDLSALRYAKGMVADPRTDAGAALLVSPAQVAVADQPRDLPDALMSMVPDPVLVLPVGAWARMPARRPSERLALVPPAPTAAPAPATPGAVAEPSRPVPDDPFGDLLF